MTVWRWFVITAVVVASTAAAADRPTRADAKVADRVSHERAAPPRPAPVEVAAPALRPSTFRDEFAPRLPPLERPGPTLDLDAIELRLDVRTRRAHLRLRGETSLVSFKLASDIFVRGGAAAIDAHLEIAAGGHRLELSLPDVELAPRSYLGERYLEVRVPFVRRKF